MVKKTFKKRSVRSGDNEGPPVLNLATPVKSESDKKDYKLITLANGLRALLVSDPSPKPEDDESCTESEEEASEESGNESSEEEENDTSSGDEEDCEEDDSDIEGDEKLAGLALMVDVGSFCDPEKYQGLAHFLEHMIFMGSTKFPSENAFDNHIKKHGGFDNANTEAEETLFYFEICEDHLDSSIKRFVALLKEPLLKKTSMTRERDAIESEFVEVKQDDETRRDALLASVCGRPGHVSRSFGWGNNKSLKDDVEDDDDLHAKLVEFKNKHYFADRMYLCVQARASLEFLEDLVLRNFTELESSPPGITNYFEGMTYKNAFTDDYYKKVFLMKQVAKTYKLEFTWCMPPIIHEYRVKPDHFVSFIMGYEGKGSLVAYLRKKFWALDIVVGVSSSGFDSNSIYSLFNVCIYLTETGFNHIKEIVEATYAFIAMLNRVSSFEKVYSELQCIEATTFRYQLQKPAYDNVQNLVFNMKYYKPEDILNGSDLYFEFDEQKIKSFIKFLAEEECNIMISSHQNYQNIPYDQTEKWFGVEYATIDKPNDWAEVIKNPREFPEFFMIEPNIYISKDFRILSRNPDSELIPLYPERLIDTKTCEMWFRQDNKFELPHVCINVYFTSPAAIESAKSAMLTTLFGLMIKYFVVEELYPATCAGLDYSLYTAEQGVILKLHGYNEKIHIVAESIADTMKNFGKYVTKDNFETYLLLQRRSYYNNLFNPKKLNKDNRLGVLEHNHFSQSDKYNLTWEVTQEDLKEFSVKFLEQLKLKMLIQGNYTKEMAVKVAETLIKKIEPKEIPDPSVMHQRTRQIPLGTNYLMCKNFNPADANTTVCNFYQIGPITLRNECIMDFIKLLTDENLFDTLRTKEQLGYDVSSAVRMNFGILAYSITVNSQEDKFTAGHVDERIESFRLKIIEFIGNMRRSEFEHNKRSLIKIKRVMDNSLNEEVQRNWNEIVSEEYIFSRNKIEAECVSTITREEIIEFLMNTSGQLRKMSFQTVGNAAGTGGDELDIDMEQCDLPKCMTKEYIFSDEIPTVRNVEAFKKDLFVYPRTKTLIDFQSNHLDNQ